MKTWNCPVSLFLMWAMYTAIQKTTPAAPTTTPALASAARLLTLRVAMMLTIPATITRQAMVGEVGYFRGKLGLAVRAELIDPNTDKQDNDDELWLSACVGWHFVRNLLRFQLQYDHRQERAGVALANDVLLAKMMVRL